MHTYTLHLSGLGCKLVKYSADVGHPHPISHSCMCPEAMRKSIKYMHEVLNIDIKEK